MAEKKKVFKHNDFVWKSLRIGFWIMIGTLVVTYLIAAFIPNVFPSWLVIFLNVISFLSIPFVLTVSIIHLTKHKEKAFAVTALVLSSLTTLLVILSLFIAILIASGNTSIPGYS